MGKDVKKRFTIEFSANMKDLEKQVKATAGNLKSILENMGNASDKMTYFKELVSYISQVDDALGRFKEAHGADTFAKMFGGLDKGLQSMLESVLGATETQLTQLDVIRGKMRELTFRDQTTNPITGDELKQIEQEIRSLYESIGMLDEAKISGRGAIETRIGNINRALANFAIVFDGATSRIRNGLGIGESFEIQQLEESIQKYKKLLDYLDKIKQVKKALSNANVPKAFGTATSAEEVIELLNAYKDLKATMQSMQDTGDTSSIQYYETLIEYARVAAKLYSSSESADVITKLSEFSFGDKSLIKALGFNPSNFKNINDTFNLAPLLTQMQSEIITFFDGISPTLAQNMAHVISSEAVNLEKQLQQLREGVIKGKTPAPGGDVAQSDSQVAQNKKVTMSYDALINKVQEYYDLAQRVSEMNYGQDGANELLAKLYEYQDFFRDLAGGDGHAVNGMFDELETDEISVDEFTQRFCTRFNIDIPTSIDATQSKLREFFALIETYGRMEFISEADANSGLLKLSEMKAELVELGKQGAITAQQMSDVHNAFDNTETHLREISTGGVPGGHGGGGQTGGIEGNGIIANVDFTSLENTIKAELALLSNKLDNVLKVELVKDGTKDIQGTVDGIRSAIDHISSAISSMKSSQEADAHQSEVDVMKANLTKLLQTVSDFNERKVGGRLNRQELSASILSDGSISVGHGELGTVPWNRVASALVANLTKSLLVDVHSHPFERFFGKNQRYAVDAFSGSQGDLGAFRFSKSLGASLSAMITGNIMRTLDVSKLSDNQMQLFATALQNREKQAASSKQYSGYITYDNATGKAGYIEQDTLAGQHKVTEIFESLMYKAFEDIGLSRDYVDQEIFKKYDLTNDAQLTELAERLILLSNASQSATSPVERLADIIRAFGGDISSGNAKTQLKAFEKGELHASTAFNELTGNQYHISPQTMDALLNIDTAHETPVIESILTQIVGILDTINANVTNIDHNTSPGMEDKYDAIANDIINFANEMGDTRRLTRGIDSIYDERNISDFKMDDVMAKATGSYESFMQELNGLSDMSYMTDIDALLRKFATAVSHIQDALKQADLYQTSTGKSFSYHGEPAQDYLLEYMRSTNIDDVGLFDVRTVHTLMEAISSAKRQFNIAKPDSSTDSLSTTITAKLSDICATLDQIYGVLHGFTGVAADTKNSAQYKEPIVDSPVNSSELSNQDLSVLNAILQTLQDINSCLHANTSDDMRRLTSDEIVAAMNTLVDNLRTVLTTENLQTGKQSDQDRQTSDDGSYALESTLQGVKSVLESILNSVNSSAENERSTEPLLGVITELKNVANSIVQYLSRADVEKEHVTEPIDEHQETDSYALESTLQSVKGILSSILTAISGNDMLTQLTAPLLKAVSALNNVADGIVKQQQARKSDTSVANARIADRDSYTQIKSVALDALGDRAIDSEVTEMKALANGIVQVTGWLQVAEDAWEGFTVQVNEANEASKLTFSTNSKAARAAAEQARAAQQGATGGAQRPQHTKEEWEDIVKERAQARIDQLTQEGKNATVRFGDDGRYTISILEEIGGLTQRIFQSFDQNDQMIERTTATMANKTLAKIQDLQKIAMFGHNKGLVGDGDELYRQFNQASAELDKMNSLYSQSDMLTNSQIVAWNQQIQLVQQLGKEIQKLVAKRQNPSELFSANKNKQVATFNADYERLKKSIDIPDSFVARIQNAGDAIRSALDDGSLRVAITNWAALRKEIEATALQQDLYKKKASSGTTTNKKSYAKNVAEKAQQKYNVIEQYAEPYMDDSFVVGDAMRKYQIALKELIALQAKLDNGTATADDVTQFDILTRSCNEYAKQLERVIKLSNQLVNNAEESGGDVSPLRDNDDVQSYNGRANALRNFIQTTYGASASIGDLNGDATTLTFTLKKGDGTITNMVASLNAARTAIAATSQGTHKATSAFGKFFGELKSKARSLTTYIISMTGVQEAFQVIRQGISSVIEIDSALTEMKKVTDETNASYDQFLQNMSGTAGAIGSTVAELTTMAAEWARLGYSMSESADLAKSTAILLNVSEFTNATAASESLISTMQAFGYAANESMHVVDILNEVKVTCLLIQ